MHTFRKSAEIRPNSFKRLANAFEMLFGGAAETLYPRKIGADACFDFRGAGRYEIQEQAFLLPNDEVMTLLIIPAEGLG